MSLPALFEMYRGDDYTMQLTFEDELSQAIDVTGWELKSTMKLSTELPDDDPTNVQVDIGPLSGADATNGIAYITYPNSQTGNLIPGEYLLDVQKEHLGSVLTLFTGTVTVKPDVTWRKN